MAETLVEICVDTVDGIAAAARGGADRIELCSALALGGMTPSVGLMTAAAGCGLPVHAMIRPRAGGFRWRHADLTAMRDDVAAVGEAGLAGVVIGALDDRGGLDLPVLRALMADAAGLSVTLHRCIDLIEDRVTAMEQAIDLGIGTILSSGGAARAVDGLGELGRLMDRAAGRITIMPGSGITADTVWHLRGLSPLAIHASCSVAVTEEDDVVRLGFGPIDRRDTSAEAVRALVAEVRAW
ncbi:MAG: copper homeostasis protein CutC [Rhodobacteraceae bacterium PARR1]|nr:MAG: copper homeostasis protein CutC [Rhodobacteraceae bacterium PARR1]